MWQTRLGSNSEIDGFNKLRTEWKFAILKIDAFANLKTEKLKTCQDRKNYLKNSSL